MKLTLEKANELMKERGGSLDLRGTPITALPDNLSVGHNIRQSDLHYIDAAARRAGVRLENPFFDTYRFARTLKEAQGWENVKLEYLSEVFGIAQPDAHRAWCDAQANALLYGKLKELAR